MAVMTICIIIQITEEVACNMLKGHKADLCWFNYRPIYIAYDAHIEKKSYHKLDLIDAKILS